MYKLKGSRKSLITISSKSRSPIKKRSTTVVKSKKRKKFSITLKNIRIKAVPKKYKRHTADETFDQLLFLVLNLSL